MANDGKSAVVGYGGRNLVPQNVSLSQPVLTFYREGMPVHTIALGKLYKHRGDMIRTVSHYAWMQSARFNKSNQFVLTLVDGRIVKFSSSGQRLHEGSDGK